VLLEQLAGARHVVDGQVDVVELHSAQSAE
jgi:hypothetical protein